MSRRVGDKIVIGDDIVITVVDVHKDFVRLGIDAPSSVPINRLELLEAVGQENKAATLNQADAAATLESLRGISVKPGLIPKPGLMPKPSVTKQAELWPTAPAAENSARHTAGKDNA